MKRELTTSRRLLPALPRPTTLRRRPDSSLSEPFARSDHIGLFLWAIGIVRRMKTIGRKWLGAVPKSSARRKNLKNSETRKIIAVRHFQVSVCPASTPIHPPLARRPESKYWTSLSRSSWNWCHSIRLSSSITGFACLNPVEAFKIAEFAASRDEVDLERIGELLDGKFARAFSEKETFRRDSRLFLLYPSRQIHQGAAAIGTAFPSEDVQDPSPETVVERARIFNAILLMNFSLRVDAVHAIEFLEPSMVAAPRAL